MKSYYSILLLLLISVSAKTQTWQNGIIGGWIDGEGDGKIEIFKEGDQYYGKITWLREPNEENGKPKFDEENPNSTKRSQPILGLIILKNFTFKDGYWQNGTIYDPKNGKTYDCEMWLDGKNSLKIRGYWGIVYRTDTWTRAK